MEVRLEPEGDLGVPRMDFEGFFRARFASVARTAAIVARDAGTGQDVAQEAFVRAHVRWSDFESDEHASHFVYRVAVNLARSHLRKYLRVSLYGLRRWELDPVPDHAPARAEWIDLVEALGGIPGRQRACLALVDFVGMDSTAAARVLGISPTTVRAHLMRGRRTLRARLSSQED
jgi:RNA polymerase sigma-70 factor (ECF subfamily)